MKNRRQKLKNTDIETSLNIHRISLRCRKIHLDLYKWTSPVLSIEVQSREPWNRAQISEDKRKGEGAAMFRCWEAVATCTGAGGQTRRRHPWENRLGPWVGSTPPDFSRSSGVLTGTRLRPGAPEHAGAAGDGRLPVLETQRTETGQPWKWGLGLRVWGTHPGMVRSEQHQQKQS